MDEQEKSTIKSEVSPKSISVSGFFQTRKALVLAVTVNSQAPRVTLTLEVTRSASSRTYACITYYFSFRQKYIHKILNKSLSLTTLIILL